ncbi:MAG: DUF488 domain-containing protein [Candidatus Poribacteria bacterium]|nr:DUF488 domain-containing protein [Candidatus Poribacteria bacterium]MDE0325324.1 DUF488 domain-containing protein [Candidatus Poribacteria bacterium]
MKKIKIITIGVYGFDETGFFDALCQAGVDTFCDIRNRRGVRGATYAFANSKRLQARLAELGIRYIYRKDLGPTKTVREKQTAADKATKTAKRKRTTLGEAFIEAYHTECLAEFEPQSLLDELESDAKVVALFCVETAPEACHRSLVADKLAQAFNLEVEDILP